VPDLQIFFDIDAALHERDGAALDVDLDGAAWSGVDALVADLVGKYETAIAHGGAGTMIALPTNVLAVVEQEQSIHVLFESAERKPSRLQLFVCEEEGGPWIEVTFFSEDAGGLDAESFVAWVDELARIACAAGWYFRIENASWEIGDVGPESGVVAARVPGS
jgi:hypothetical protein